MLLNWRFVILEEILKFSVGLAPLINNPWTLIFALGVLGLVAYQAFLKSKDKTNSTVVDNNGAKITNQQNGGTVKIENHY
jgi:hypothetical protein